MAGRFSGSTWQPFLLSVVPLLPALRVVTPEQDLCVHVVPVGASERILLGLLPPVLGMPPQEIHWRDWDHRALWDGQQGQFLLVLTLVLPWDHWQGHWLEGLAGSTTADSFITF